MYASQDPLLAQLADRTRSFSTATDISLNQIAKLIGTDTSNFSAFINGRAGLSAVSVCRLMELLNSSKRQLDQRLNAKPVQIRHFQSEGAPMQLDAGSAWVSGQSGVDPNDSSDIVSTPTARDLPNARDYEQQTIGFLRQQQELYRSAIQEIENYLTRAPKATVNRAGTTEPARRIDDNQRSRTAGPRPSRFSR